MRKPLIAVAACLVVAASSACNEVVVVERDAANGAGGGDEAVSMIRPNLAESPLGGVDRIDCPNDKPWAATITTSGAAFAPNKVIVNRGHIVMFQPAGGAPYNMVADDGSFVSGPIRETACLRFNRTGSYPYHSAGAPEMTGIVIVHE
jgi:plastocyanin